MQKYKSRLTSAKRLLGRILIDGNFVSHESLKTALEVQRETNTQLGQILVSMGVLHPADLKVILAIQKNLTSVRDAVGVAAGFRELLGQLLLKAKRINQDQVDAALDEQRSSGEKLGEILVRQGLLHINELDVSLQFQHVQDKRTGTNHLRLGEIMVATEQITRGQLDDVLTKQKISKGKIGDLLVESGYLKSRQLGHGLKLQQKLVSAALITVLSMVGLPEDRARAESYSGRASRLKVGVSATVLERTTIKTLNQMDALVITSSDIAKGYVEIPAASRVQIKSNNPRGYFLAFEVAGGSNDLFTSINVVVGGREFQLSSNRGWIPQSYSRDSVTLDLKCRFSLSENAQPGTYAWPLQVSVTSM